MKNEKLLISVIIPVFQVEKYIARCIYSLKKQTLQPDEVILIDDCGNDSSIDLAMHVIDGDSRFRIVKNSENLGQGGSRDRGVVESRGEYILMLDADDYLAPNALEILYHTVEKNRADIVVFQAKHLYRFSRRIYPKFSGLTCAKGVDYIPAFLRNQAYKEDLPCVENYEWNKLISRDLIVNNNTIHLSGRVCGEDFYFIAQLLFYAKNVVCIPETLYFYERRNSTSITAQKSLSLFFSALLPFNATKKFFQTQGYWDKNISDRFYTHIYSYLYFNIIHRISFFSLKFNDRLLSLLSIELKEKELWHREQHLWRNLELFYDILAKKIIDPNSNIKFAPLFWKKFKIVYIPMYLAKVKYIILEKLRLK